MLSSLVDLRCRATLRLTFLDLTRHVAPLHRLALDLRVALRRLTRLGWIAKHATPLAAEALVARRGGPFDVVVVADLARDLVDDARALVQIFLFSAVLLHALEDELDAVHRRVSFA